MNTRVKSVAGTLVCMLVGHLSAILFGWWKYVQTVEERRRVRRAARAIRDVVAIEAVDVLAPSASQYTAWGLDAVLRECKGVPPEVFRELGLAGLTLQPRPPQAEYQHVAARV